MIRPPADQNSPAPLVPALFAPALLAPALLAIETAGSRCSAAVARGETVLTAECRMLRHGHAEALFPMIERVIAASGLRPSDLEVVAVAVGPGGFTGIRVGLAAAHGIALATGAILVGVTGFAAVAAVAGASPGSGRATLLVALDSRRADLYVQLFAPDATPRAAPAAVLPDALADHVAGLAGDSPLLIAGDAAEAAAAALGRRPDLVVAGGTAPDATGVAAAALRQLRDGRGGPVRPFYLRPPDVTLPRRRAAVPAAPQ